MREVVRKTRSGRLIWPAAALLTCFLFGLTGCFPPYIETRYATPTTVLVAPVATPAQITTPVLVPREVTPAQVPVPEPGSAAPQSPFLVDEPAVGIRVDVGPAGGALEVTTSPVIGTASETWRAVMEMARGRHEEAAAILERVVQHEQSTEAVFNLAVCHDILGNTEEAVAGYRGVVHDVDFGAYARARIDELSGEAGPEPDRETMERARHEFVNGMELYDAADHSGAIATFQRSYALVHHPRILFNLAVCYQRLGRNITAASFYHLAISGNGGEDDVREQARAGLRDLVRSSGQ
jgi:hypothetical protein